jgi:hypothetical protein
MRSPGHLPSWVVRRGTSIGAASTTRRTRGPPDEPGGADRATPHGESSGSGPFDRPPVGSPLPHLRGQCTGGLVDRGALGPSRVARAGHSTGTSAGTCSCAGWGLVSAVPCDRRRRRPSWRRFSNLRRWLAFLGSVRGIGAFPLSCRRSCGRMPPGQPGGLDRPIPDCSRPCAAGRYREGTWDSFTSPLMMLSGLRGGSGTWRPAARSDTLARATACRVLAGASGSSPKAKSGGDCWPVPNPDPRIRSPVPRTFVLEGS